MMPRPGHLKSAPDVSGVDVSVGERLWTPQEVAGYLGVPVRTLYAWRSRGAGPQGLRVGKHLRYRKADLDAWLEGQA